MPMPAAIAAKGLSQPSPPPGSAASAMPGTASAATNVRISERRTDCPPCVVVSASVMGLGRFNSPGNVDGRQHHEDEGLQERDQELERVEEPDGEGRHQQRRRPPGTVPADRPPDPQAENAVEAHKEEETAKRMGPARHLAERPREGEKGPRG